MHGLNLIEEGSVGETPSKKPQKIAVKTLRKGATDEDKAGFLKEAQLMSKFQHPHILQGGYPVMRSTQGQGHQLGHLATWWQGEIIKFIIENERSL